MVAQKIVFNLTSCYVPLIEILKKGPRIKKLPYFEGKSVFFLGVKGQGKTELSTSGPSIVPQPATDHFENEHQRSHYSTVYVNEDVLSERNGNFGVLWEWQVELTGPEHAP